MKNEAHAIRFGCHGREASDVVGLTKLRERRMIREVGLVLSGDVSLDDFAKAVADFRSLMSALTKEAASGQVNWLVADLERNGAQVTALGEGADTDVDSTARAYGELGDAMEYGRVIPFHAPVKKYAGRLAGLARGRIEHVRFESPDFASVISRRQEAPEQGGGEAPVSRVEASADAWGAVQGRVQTLTSRGGLHFTLYDSVFDRAVSCYLSPDIEDPEDFMRNCWDHLATATGLIKRDDKSGRPLNVRQITSVETVEESDPWAYRKAIGAASAGSESPEARIRKIRDAS